MFINHIYGHARDNPDHLAIINSGEEITYLQFAATIEAVRNYLIRTRLPRAGVIVNITSNLYHDWVLLLALRSLGLTTISGTSWRVLENLGLKTVTGLVSLATKMESIEEFRSAQPDCTMIELPRGMMDSLPSGSSPIPIADGRFGDHIVYTSGTTGTYKKVIYSGEHCEGVIELKSIGRTGRIDPAAVYYSHAFGPWTAAGHNMPLNCWYRGATVLFEQRPDWGAHFYEYPVTRTFFVPGLIDVIAKTMDKRPADLAKLQVVIGGGFLDAKRARGLIEQLDCELIIAYSGTEFITCLENIYEQEDDVVWLAPASGTFIEIVDPEDRRVEIGTEGIVRVKCNPGYPVEYLDDPEATARHFRGGYFYPGDMAVQRGDGKVRILGRVDDVLNLSGQKIAIEPFEDSVRKVLGIETLCAFNLQDDSGKDMLVIVIEGSELPNRARLQTLSSKLRQVPQIRYSLIDRFPRGENGMMKINRQRLLEMLRASWVKEAEQSKAKAREVNSP